MGLPAALLSAAEPANDGAPAAPPGKARYALLVGCTKYDNNPAMSLVGPANDVELLRGLLVHKFGFAPSQIVELSEKAADDCRPTHANIAREFAALAKQAKSGDQVIVLLAGHGSQQPEQDPPDPHYPKSDGKDQIFLPADVGRWIGGGRRTVTNAIPDYELRAWTKRITAKGASLWIVVDACCSGATLRGAQTSRKIEPADLGIPPEAFADAADRARKRGGSRGAEPRQAMFQLDDQSDNFVALYAARPDEPTVELALPIDAEGASQHGLLTYTLCEILDRCTSDVTYSELHRMICNRYAQMGRTGGPRPLVEGLARDRDVLGRFAPARSRFNLIREAPGPLENRRGPSARIDRRQHFGRFSAAH